MDLRNLGFDTRLFGILEDMLDFPEEPEKSRNNASRAYVRDAKAMAATPADVVEYPGSYVFVVDMPGIRAGEIMVQIENDNVLVVSGERKREREEGTKYLSMERRTGKFMRRFQLPENANVETVTAACQDGVLRVAVEKVRPPEPRTKTIEVKAG